MVMHPPPLVGWAYLCFRRNAPSLLRHANCLVCSQDKSDNGEVCCPKSGVFYVWIIWSGRYVEIGRRGQWVCYMYDKYPWHVCNALSPCVLLCWMCKYSSVAVRPLSSLSWVNHRTDLPHSESRLSECGKGFAGQIQCRVALSFLFYLMEQTIVVSTTIQNHSPYYDSHYNRPNSSWP